LKIDNARRAARTSPLVKGSAVVIRHDHPRSSERFWKRSANAAG
jgi:hypothetical protein